MPFVGLFSCETWERMREFGCYHLEIRVWFMLIIIVWLLSWIIFIIKHVEKSEFGMRKGEGKFAGSMFFLFI